eukprot:scaffold8608_cov93-Skeletonema_dohrnii-CCMP3373.AAC.2
MGILILRHQCSINFFTSAQKANSSNDISDRYYSPSLPMTAISGILESSHQALSNRRIISLIGRLLPDCPGQKRG